MIKKTVNKVVEFIEQNAYFHAPYLDFIGVYTVGCDWKHFKNGDRVILLKAYSQDSEYYILNKVDGDIRLSYINGYTNEYLGNPLLIPENLKFYIGGLND